VRVIVPIVLGVTVVIAVEAIRWFSRPAARRLRVIRKIGGPR
jgi:hypothetical protein